MQSYIEQALDFARFDAVHDTELNLVVSKTTIRPGDLKRPPLVVANYFFDGIPQELIYVGQARFTRAMLSSSFRSKTTSSPAEALERMKLAYEHRRAPRYEEDTYPYRDVIAYYQQELEDSHILFPEVGLTCMERLNQLSTSGFMLLRRIKEIIISIIEVRRTAAINLPWRFSLTANYHAPQRCV